MELHVGKAENNFNKNNIKDKSYSIFELAKSLFGIEILIIKEIVPVSNITHIPNVPPYILGVFNLRGIITTLVDIRKIFDLKVAAIKSDSMVLVIETESVRFGILSEKILDIIPIEELKIKKINNSMTDKMSPYISGIYHHKDLGDIHLLDKVKIKNIL
jgi:purine-binding chemotaxis protein CheW